MSSLYARWMYDWETRLTSVDSNRVVRPLEWGIEWTHNWPCRNGFSPTRTDAECERYLCEYNRRAIASSDEFFAYRMPLDFRLENREVQVFSTREVPEPALENKVRGTRAEFFAFHFASTHALSGKQSGERALVPGQRKERGRIASALEFGRAALQLAGSYL
jgi:hypothetical protein